MDVTTFTQMIGTVGFPIAACCVMFWQNNNLQNTLTEFVTTLQKINDRIDCMEHLLNVGEKTDES